MNFNKKFKRRDGFTLIELLVVIAIIGILAVVAVPALFKNINKAKIAKVESDYNAVKSSTLSYYAENNQLPTEIKQLSKYMDKELKNTHLGGIYIIDSKSTIADNKIQDQYGNPTKAYEINSYGKVGEYIELHDRGDVFLRLQSQLSSSNPMYISKQQLEKLIKDIGYENIYISGSTMGSKYQHNAIYIRIANNILPKPTNN